MKFEIISEMKRILEEKLDESKQPKYFTMAELQKKYCIKSPTSVRKLIREKILHPKWLGGKQLFSADEIESFLKKQSKK